MDSDSHGQQAVYHNDAKAAYEVHALGEGDEAEHNKGDGPFGHKEAETMKQGKKISYDAGKDSITLDKYIVDAIRKDKEGEDEEQ